MMMPFEWDVRVSSKDHTVTAPTSRATSPATERYTTLRGTTRACDQSDVRCTVRIAVLIALDPIEVDNLSRGKGSESVEVDDAEVRPAAVWGLLRIDDAPAFIVVPESNDSACTHHVSVRIKANVNIR